MMAGMHRPAAPAAAALRACGDRARVGLVTGYRWWRAACPVHGLATFAWYVGDRVGPAAGRGGSLVRPARGLQASGPRRRSVTRSRCGVWDHALAAAGVAGLCPGPAGPEAGLRS